MLPDGSVPFQACEAIIEYFTIVEMRNVQGGVYVVLS